MGWIVVALLILSLVLIALLLRGSTTPDELEFRTTRLDFKKIEKKPEP